MTENFPGFFEAVEAATNGKYKFEIEWFPVNTLLAPADIYDGVKNGIVDAGQSSMGYTPRQFPVMQTMMQPGIARRRTRPRWWPPVWNCMRSTSRKNSPTPTFSISTRVDRASSTTTSPITTVDQLKGMRIRCSGTSTEAVKLVGADPIAMPMADVFEAAQKGTIDALLSPAETLEGWKHNELFDYSTFMPQLYASDFFWVAMNQAKWDSFPDDLKAAFESVASRWAATAGAIWDYAHEHAIKVSADTKQHQVVQLPEAGSSQAHRDHQAHP